MFVVLKDCLTKYGGGWILNNILDVCELEEVDRVTRKHDINGSLEGIDTIFDCCFVLIVFMLKIAPDIVYA